MDKRKNKKGRTEYLVRWKGYSSEDDTWEPEQHLVNCEEFIHDFNRRHAEKPREGSLARTSRTSPSNARKQICRSTHGSLTKVPPKGLMISKDSEPKTPQLLPTGQKFRKSMTPSLSGRKNMDLAKSGIKILVPKSPIKSRTAVDGFPSESPEKLEPTEQGQEDTAAPEVAAEKPVGALLGPGAERARMGSRPRIHPLVPQGPGPATATAAMATGLAVNGKGECREVVWGVHYWAAAGSLGPSWCRGTSVPTRLALVGVLCSWPHWALTGWPWVIAQIPYHACSQVHSTLPLRGAFPYSGVLSCG